MSRLPLHNGYTGSHFTTEFPAMAALSIQHCTAALLVFSLADPGSLQEVS